MARKRKARPDPIPTEAARYRAYRRWRRWFGDIKNQIFDIHHRRQLYREVMAMVDANPAIQVPSAFYTWMRTVYVYDATVAVRRLVDWDRRTISFVRLMQAIGDHPEVMTRARFVSGYRGWLRDAGHRDFERFASLAAKTIDRRVIRRHQRELLAAAGRLKTFVNKHVAHNDRRPMRQLPTYAELDDCIDLLGRLAKTYCLLLEQSALVEVVPVIQHDWKAPFRVSWIPAPAEARPPDDGVAVVPVPVTPPAGDRPALVREIIEDHEWLRDSTAKAHQVAQQVMDEFDAARDC